MRVEEVSGGAMRLIGHWHSGEWRDEPLTLVRRDGFEVRIVACMEAAVSDLVVIRGQRSLLVRDGALNDLQPGCVRPADR
jgi:hypothetical protein